MAERGSVIVVCDRCDTEIGVGFRRHTVQRSAGGPQPSRPLDLCGRCDRQLSEFMDGLPVAALDAF